MRCRIVACGSCLADDWPQWLGPQRDGVWRERGIVEEFSSDKLTPRCRVNIGPGCLPMCESERAPCERSLRCVRAAPWPRASAPWPGATPRCRVRASVSACASRSLARVSPTLPGARRALPRARRPLARASSPLGRVNRPLGVCQPGLGCVRDDHWSVSVSLWSVQ